MTLAIFAAGCTYAVPSRSGNHGWPPPIGQFFIRRLVYTRLSRFQAIRSPATLRVPFLLSVPAAGLIVGLQAHHVQLGIFLLCISHYEASYLNGCSRHPTTRVSTMPLGNISLILTLMNHLSRREWQFCTPTEPSTMYEISNCLYYKSILKYSHLVTI